jgi:diguanylate cyclase (GGDEF)-like protein
MSYLGEKEVQRFNDTNQVLSLMLIDVNHFKMINDEHGHKVDDDVLVKISQFMREHVRSHDLVTRWGGEEFLIILPNTSKEDAMFSAEHIRKAFVSYATIGLRLWAKNSTQPSVSALPNLDKKMP